MWQFIYHNCINSYSVPLRPFYADVIPDGIPWLKLTFYVLIIINLREDDPMADRNMSPIAPHELYLIRFVFDGLIYPFSRE
jgi:hypothetical protein